MIKIRPHIILLLFLVTAIGNAQDFETIVSDSKDYYTSLNKYSIKSTYTMFKSATSNVEIDKQYTQLIKSDDKYYFKMGNAEIIFTPNFFIKVNHDEKMLLYSKRFSDENLMNNQFPLYELKDRFKTKNIQDKGDVWICTLTGNKEVSVPYKKIVFYVDKRSFAITKQVYFFKNTISKRYTGQDNPPERLEIVNYKFETNINGSDDIFSLNRYLLQNENTFTSSNYTKDYKILVQ